VRIISPLNSGRKKGRQFLLASLRAGERQRHPLQHVQRGSGSTRGENLPVSYRLRFSTQARQHRGGAGIAWNYGRTPHTCRRCLRPKRTARLTFYAEPCAATFYGLGAQAARRLDITRSPPLTSYTSTTDLGRAFMLRHSSLPNA